MSISFATHYLSFCEFIFWVKFLLPSFFIRADTQREPPHSLPPTHTKAKSQDFDCIMTHAYRGQCYEVFLSQHVGNETIRIDKSNTFYFSSFYIRNRLKVMKKIRRGNKNDSRYANRKVIVDFLKGK